MTIRALGLIFAVALLAGCTQQVVVAESAASIYLTRPSTPPPADTSERIADHELWCYRTLGDVQCYSSAQDVPPNRLVNVSPQRIYPLTAEAYRDEVNRQQIAMATGGPASLNPYEAPLSDPSKDDKPWWSFMDFMIP